MILKDNNINQTMLVPMELQNLIPEDHPCYFIQRRTCEYKNKQKITYWTNECKN